MRCRIQILLVPAQMKNPENTRCVLDTSTWCCILFSCEHVCIYWCCGVSLLHNNCLFASLPPKNNQQFVNLKNPEVRKVPGHTGTLPADWKQSGCFNELGQDTIHLQHFIYKEKKVHSKHVSYHSWSFFSSQERTVLTGTTWVNRSEVSDGFTSKEFF